MIKQKAIVLRTVAFRESSSIATLLTPDYGKVAVMVRGVKKPGSKLSGLFEQANVLEVVYYDKPGRSVQNLKEASLYMPTYHIRSRMEKLALATAATELVDQLVYERESAEGLFGFLSNLLGWLHETDFNSAHLFPYIQLRVAEIMGIGIRPDSKPGKNGGYHSFLCVEEGEISTQQKQSLCLKLQPQQTLYCQLALQGERGRLLRSSFPPGEIRNLIHHLDVYLKHHLDGLRDRKSDHIFNLIL